MDNLGICGVLSLLQDKKQTKHDESLLRLFHPICPKSDDAQAPIEDTGSEQGMRNTYSLLHIFVKNPAKKSDLYIFYYLGERIEHCVATLDY